MLPVFCATERPRASVKTQAKSLASLDSVENEVRTIAFAASSTIEISRDQMTSSRTASNCPSDEEGDEEVEEEDERDKQVQGEEGVAEEALILDIREGEVAEHPGVESDEGVLEGGELGETEEDHPHAGEEEEDDQSQSEEVADVAGHSGGDLEQRADHARHTQQRDDAEPGGSGEEGVVDPHALAERDAGQEVEGITRRGLSETEEACVREAEINKEVGKDKGDIEGDLHERERDLAVGEAQEEGVEQGVEREEEGKRLRDQNEHSLNYESPLCLLKDRVTWVVGIGGVDNGKI